MNRLEQRTAPIFCFFSIVHARYLRGCTKYHFALCKFRMDVKQRCVLVFLANYCR